MRYLSTYIAYDDDDGAAVAVATCILFRLFIYFFFIFFTPTCIFSPRCCSAAHVKITCD